MAANKKQSNNVELVSLNSHLKANELIVLNAYIVREYGSKLMNLYSESSFPSLAGCAYMKDPIDS